MPLLGEPYDHGPVAFGKGVLELQVDSMFESRSRAAHDGTVRGRSWSRFTVGFTRQD